MEIKYGLKTSSLIKSTPFEGKPHKMITHRFLLKMSSQLCTARDRKMGSMCGNVFTATINANFHLGSVHILSVLVCVFISF